MSYWYLHTEPRSIQWEYTKGKIIVCSSSICKIFYEDFSPTTYIVQFEVYIIICNKFQCVDPVKKCASDEWHTSPAAQQLSRRGPLYVTIPKHEVTPEKALQTESGSKHVYDQQDQEEELGQ